MRAMSLRIFDRDRGMIGQYMEKRDRVVRQLLGARIENFNCALCSLASPQRQRNHGPDFR